MDPSAEVAAIKESLQPIETTPEQTQTLADAIDFKSIFHIKGKPGLYFLISYPNKSGMVGLREFLGPKTIVSHKRDLVQLESYVFNKKDDTQINLSKVFENLEPHHLTYLKALSIEELMDIMVPEYDPAAFKPSHALKVVRWYSEIKAKIDA